MAALFGDEYIIALDMFVASIAWVTVKALTWEEIKGQRSKGRIRGIILTVGLLLLACSSVWVRERRNKAKSTAETGNLTIPVGFHEDLPDKRTVRVHGVGMDLAAIYPRSRLEKSKVDGILSVGGEHPLQIYIEDGQLFCDAILNDGDESNPVFLLSKNSSKLNDFRLDRNFTANALEIVNDKQQPIFQLIRNRPGNIETAGRFVANGSALSVPPVEKLFRYPSWKYQGQFAEGHDGTTSP